jgi:hypothetical protein
LFTKKEEPTWNANERARAEIACVDIKTRTPRKMLADNKWTERDLSDVFVCVLGMFCDKKEIFVSWEMKKI